MVDQDTKTLEEADGVTKEAPAETGKQAEEKEPPKPDIESKSQNGQPESSDGLAKASDENVYTSSDEEKASQSANDEKSAENSGDAEEPKSASNDEPKADVPDDADKGDIKSDGTDTDESGIAADSDGQYEVSWDESTDDDDQDGTTDSPDAQSPAPSEVTIGVSAVEPLDDPTVSESVASDVVEKITPPADLELANDDQVDNEDRVEKPVVDEEPAPGAVPELSDNGASAKTSEDLDKVNLESGDGDATGPSKSVPDADPDPAQTKLSESDSRANSDDDSDNATQAKPDDDGKSSKLQTDLEAEKPDDDGDTEAAGKDVEQPADIPTVDPAVSAAVELPDQQAPASVETEPTPTGIDLGSDGIVMPPEPAGPENSLDVMDLIDPVAPVAEVQFDNVDSPVTGPDPNAASTGEDGGSSLASDGQDSELVPGSKAAIEGNNAPLPGPDMGATAEDLERGSPIGAGGRDDGPTPVSDSSGVQLGYDSGTNGDGSKFYYYDWGDTGQQMVTVYDDGNSKNETISADGSTETTTLFNDDGETIYKVTTTHNEDGSTVTEKELPDGTVTQEYSDGTSIVLRPDGTTEVTNPDGSTEVYKSEEEKQDDEDTATNASDDSDGDNATTGDDTSKADNEASATSQDPDGYVDPRIKAQADAMREAETEWEQAIKGGSTVNPGRGDAPGGAEGGGEPAPGVDDPPEDESLGPDEVPEADPVDIGLNEGTIDFGPDHVDEPQSAGSDSNLTEDLGAQTDQPESQEVDPDDTLTFDPASMLESSEDLVGAMSGFDPEEGLHFLGWGTDFEPEPDDDQGTFDDGGDLF